MNFRDLKLDDIPAAMPYFNKMKSRTCDFTVGGMFMWRDYYKMQCCFSDDTFFTRLYNSDGHMYYYLPLSDDIRKSVDEILDDQMKTVHSVRFATVPSEYFSVFSGLPYNIEITAYEDYYDYLYYSEEMRNFAGRRFAGQRNHIHKFLKTSGDWNFKVIEEEDLPEINRFFVNYIATRQKDSDEFDEENSKVKEVLNDIGRYNMKGGVLRQKGEVVGFSLGEILGDICYVHIEKSSRDVPGAYQMLVNQFAKMFTDDSIKYMNREEDMGDLGLRASKNSYHPCDKLRKYTVIVKR